MPAKRWSIVVLLCALSSLAVGVWAQADELTQQVSLSEDYVVSVPANWDVEDDAELGGFAMTGDSAGMFAFAPSQVVEAFDLKEDDPLIDILIETYRQFAGDRVRRTDVEEITLGEFPAARYRYTDDEFEGIFVIVDFGEGQFGLLDFYTHSGDLDDQLELAAAIAETFGHADVVIDPKTGLPVGATSGTTSGASSGASSGTTTTSSEPCTVSTNTANTVQLHVGPGLNRAVVAFLPTNTEFEVTGSFTTDDGSEWFQLDKSEAAPNSAASEVWVARDDVDESGNCDAVADASAPPIVPIISNPPPQPTAAPGATAAPVEVGLVPGDGDWTMTLDTTTVASCEGTQTIRVNTSELFPDEPLSQIYRLRVSGGGASIIFGGDTFTMTSPGNYFGTYSFEDGFNAQVRLQVASATFMTGSIVGNFQIDGVPCSYTIPLSARHN